MSVLLVLLGISAALEILNGYHSILNVVSLILLGSFFSYLLSDLCDRTINISHGKNKKWQFIVRNLFYVYLLHDPLEYIVLKIFMNGDLLTTAWGCILYTASRTVIIFVVTLFMGELINKVKNRIAIWLEA